MLVHESPDDAIRRVVRELSSLREKEGEDLYYRTIAEVCRKDLWFLIRVILDWGWACEDLHGRTILRHIASHRNQDIAVFIPRGHMKTLMFSALVIQAILADPNCAVLVASATEKLTQDTAKLISNTLIKNKILQRAFPDVLPQSKQDVGLWGKDGYVLPNRKDRIDPTLFMASLGANVTGRHPDLIWVDDLIVPGNNTPTGYLKVENFLKECKALMPPHGRIYLTGTRYHDADPYSRIIEGKILGNKGPFNCLILSCYENDDEKQPPIYKPKVRWNMQQESGFSHHLLEQKRKELGVFFNAQYRNNPLPESDQVIRFSDINTYEARELPRYGRCMGVGLEVTGSGLLLYKTLEEECQKLKLDLPLREVITPRKAGISKADRIMSAVEPVVRQGKLFVQKWMKGDGADSDSLGYELIRLGVAKHDDIADALYMAISHMQDGLLPSTREYAHLHIAIDPAFTEKERSDWTVCMAIVVDHTGNIWVANYERFQATSPTAIAHRIIQFYQRMVSGVSIQRSVSRRETSLKKNFATSYR